MSRVRETFALDRLWEIATHASNELATNATKTTSRVATASPEIFPSAKVRRETGRLPSVSTRPDSSSRLHVP